MRWGFNNLLVGARSGSSVVTICQENPYAALRIAAAGAFSHKDSLQARSGHALRPRPRFESCSAAQVRRHHLCPAAVNPYARWQRHRHSHPRTFAEASRETESLWAAHKGTASRCFASAGCLLSSFRLHCGCSPMPPAAFASSRCLLPFVFFILSVWGRRRYCLSYF